MGNGVVDLHKDREIHMHTHMHMYIALTHHSSFTQKTLLKLYHVFSNLLQGTSTGEPS